MTLPERANDGLHAHVERVVVAAGLAPDARILDLGCGSGAFLARLRGRGFTRLAGVDIDPPPPTAGIAFSALDLDTGRLPAADASVDLVVAIEVLEHVENLGATMAEIARVLAPGGRLLATTPNVHSVEARLRLLLQGGLKQFDAIGDPTHVTPVFLHPFATLIGRHGLCIARRWGFPEDGSSPTSRGALRLLARAARLAGLRGAPAGDNLCLLVERVAAVERVERPAAAAKAEAVTAHYRAAP